MAIRTGLRRECHSARIPEISYPFLSVFIRAIRVQK
jgi:hypothetical protein